MVPRNEHNKNNGTGSSSITINNSQALLAVNRNGIGVPTNVVTHNIPSKLTNTFQSDVNAFNRSFANTQMGMYKQDNNSSLETLGPGEKDYPPQNQHGDNLMNSSNDWMNNSIEQQRNMKSLLINYSQQ